MGYVGRRIVSSCDARCSGTSCPAIGLLGSQLLATLLSRLTTTRADRPGDHDSVIIGAHHAHHHRSVGFLLWLNVASHAHAPHHGALWAGWCRSSTKSSAATAAASRLDGRRHAVAKEGFEAPRLIKVYNAQEHLGRQFDAVNDRNLRSNMKSF